MRATTKQYYELAAIRAESEKLFDFVSNGYSDYFQIDYSRLSHTASFVAEVIRENYPDLNIPLHSRIRHFLLSNTDLYEAYFDDGTKGNIEQLRKQIELIITSVFLDGGAGADWSYYDDNTKSHYSRSEGLAAASFNCYRGGLYSPFLDKPCYVDGRTLQALSEKALADEFQIREDNELIGFENRVKLVNKLGTIVETDSLFQRNGMRRLGHLADELVSLSANNIVSTENIFATLVTSFSALWVKENSPDSALVGDIWRHKAVESDTNPLGLVPFHKILQWLTYSLLEPLERFGLEVVDVERLTGLPEYRNGGLFIDSDVLKVKSVSPTEVGLDISSEFVIEWRALTIGFLDRLRPLVVELLTSDQQLDLTMGQFLQGGSWAAGRKIARNLRLNGEPPFKINLDGTLF